MNNVSVASAYSQYLREIAEMQPEDFPSAEDVRRTIAKNLADALIALGIDSGCSDDELFDGERAVMKTFGGVDFCHAVVAWRLGVKNAPITPPSIPDNAEVPA